MRLIILRHWAKAKTKKKERKRNIGIFWVFTDIIETKIKTRTQNELFILSHFIFFKTYLLTDSLLDWVCVLMLGLEKNRGVYFTCHLRLCTLTSAWDFWQVGTSYAEHGNGTLWQLVCGLKSPEWTHEKADLLSVSTNDCMF